MANEVMETGKMYAIQFSGVLLIVRYSHQTNTDYHFFTHLKYWCGHESYYKGGYCVKYDIQEIRLATPAEKYSLFRFEVEKHDV